MANEALKKLSNEEPDSHLTPISVKSKISKANVVATRAKCISYTSADMIEELDKYFILDKREIKQLLDYIFYLILTKVKEGYMVKLRNFGSFYIHSRYNKRGYDMHRRVHVEVPIRKELRLKLGPYARDFINDFKYAKHEWKHQDKMYEYDLSLKMNPLKGDNDYV